MPARVSQQSEDSTCGTKAAYPTKCLLSEYVREYSGNTSVEEIYVYDDWFPLMAPGVKLEHFDQHRLELVGSHTRVAAPTNGQVSDWQVLSPHSSGQETPARCVVTCESQCKSL